MPSARAHRIQAEKGAGRHDDFSTRPFGHADQIVMHEKRADAERQKNLAAGKRRLRNLAKNRGRRAFDDDVGVIGKLIERHYRNLVSKSRHIGSRLVVIARTHRDKPKAWLASIQPSGNRLPDCPESADRNRQLRHRSLAIAIHARSPSSQGSNTLLEDEEEVFGVDLGACGDMQPLDRAVAIGIDRGLHLHRFDGHEEIA